MLEVEDWTQSAHAPKRRAAKKSASPPLAGSSADIATPEPTPAPPDPDLEVEEPFPTRASPPQMLPARGRGNSLTAAGRSSLSRLLAQAPAEASGEAHRQLDQRSTESHSPPPEPSLIPPPSPTHTASATQGAPAPIPFRSGSRASRISTSSRFSAGRIPFVGTPGNAKAIATTALAPAPVQPVPASPSSTNSMESPKSAVLSVSPEASASDGMTNLLSYHRRRASSFQPRNSPLAHSQDEHHTRIPSATMTNGDDGGASGGSARTRLASLASGWGVSFGRKKANGSFTGERPLSGTTSNTTSMSHGRAGQSDT